LDCPYCNDNAPLVNDLAEAYVSDTRVQVLDVGVDRSASQYKEWIRRHQPNHPVLNDGSMKLTSQLGTSGYPSTYVIDCTGKVVYSHVGGWEASVKSKIMAKIDSTLQTTKCSTNNP